MAFPFHNNSMSSYAITSMSMYPRQNI
jgi:hypothetical protein